MKVSVTITADVNVDDWKLAFGLDGATASEIRQDIKEYIGDGAQQHGVFGNGEVSAVIEYK